MTAISNRTSRPRIGPVAVFHLSVEKLAEARVALTPARVPQAISRGQQEQRKEEDEEQGDHDEVPVHFRAMGETHPGHGDEPESGGKGDLDGDGMHAGRGLARGRFRPSLRDVLRIGDAGSIAALVGIRSDMAAS